MSRKVVGLPMGGSFEGQREMVGRDMGAGPLVALTHWDQQGPRGPACTHAQPKARVLWYLG